MPHGVGEVEHAQSLAWRGGTDGVAHKLAVVAGHGAALEQEASQAQLAGCDGTALAGVPADVVAPAAQRHEVFNTDRRGEEDAAVHGGDGQQVVAAEAVGLGEGGDAGPGQAVPAVAALASHALGVGGGDEQARVGRVRVVVDLRGAHQPPVLRGDVGDA